MLPKVNRLIVVVIFINLFKVSLCGECDLKKIFRTPRDFDHLEIVERAGFDRLESTTLPPTQETTPDELTSRIGNNIANAQVSLKFGADYMHGNNHISKIPVECRNHFGIDMHNHLDFPHHHLYYPPPPPPPPPHILPPPCHHPHQYYHPYPPPVPYSFPNYYYWGPGDVPPHLPPQLKDYFRRHPNYVVKEEVFIERRPLRRVEKTLTHAAAVDARSTPIRSEETIIRDLNILHENAPAQVIQSRIIIPQNRISAMDEEESPEKKAVKRDLASVEKGISDEDLNIISMACYDFLQHIASLYAAMKEDDEKKIRQDHLDQSKNGPFTEPLSPYKCGICGGIIRMHPMNNEKNNLTQDIMDELGPNFKQEKFTNDIDDFELLKNKAMLQEHYGKDFNCIKTNSEIENQKNVVQDIGSVGTIESEIIDENKRKSFSVPNITTRIYSDHFVDNFNPQLKPRHSTTDQDIFKSKSLTTSPLHSSSAVPSQEKESTSREYVQNTPTIELLLPKENVRSWNSENLPESIKVSYKQLPTPSDTTAPSQSPNYSPDLNTVTKDENYSSENLQDGLTKSCEGKILSSLSYPTSSIDPHQRPMLTEAPEFTSSSEPSSESNNCYQYDSKASTIADKQVPMLQEDLQQENFKLLVPKESVVLQEVSYSNISEDIIGLSRQRRSTQCSKCGYEHSGGEYCEKCGYPLISPAYTPDCPTYTKNHES